MSIDPWNDDALRADSRKKRSSSSAGAGSGTPILGTLFPPGAAPTKSKRHKVPKGKSHKGHISVSHGGKTRKAHKAKTPKGPKELFVLNPTPHNSTWQNKHIADPPLPPAVSRAFGDTKH
ncbi:MAG TPA: hypothetical protein VFB58_13760 [Chloroflexota bacterium]|nr:hypothetical protein [Chloroflexota bacterium]